MVICGLQASDINALNSKGKIAFIAVHMEVGGTPKTLDYQANMWPTLIRLVQAADNHSIKLTLQFNPQWASYIVADDMRLKILRTWGRNGHEIALHHHGPGHSDWNGYTNKEDMKSHSDYIGDIREMMAIVRRMSYTGKILTGGITNEDTDWPYGVKYDTNGGKSPDSLFSTPENKVFNGRKVIQLEYRAYCTTIKGDADFDEIQSACSSFDETKVMGIVFHCHDYSKKNQRYLGIDRLFSFLSRQNIKVRAVKDILFSRYHYLPVNHSEKNVTVRRGSQVLRTPESTWNTYFE